jgi:nucleoside-triphosphatase THEP1
MAEAAPERSKTMDLSSVLPPPVPSDSTGFPFFVGRTTELALLEDELRRCLRGAGVFVHLHGPGGVGKTTLLSAFVARVRATAPPIGIGIVDAIDLEPHAESLRRALEAKAGARVLIIDRFERFEGISRLAAAVVAGALRPGTLVIVADRSRESSLFEVPAFAERVSIALRNLARHEALTYLSRRGLPSTACARVADFAHGHPLALALAADAQSDDPGGSFDPARAPDLLGALCDRFLDGLVDRRRRAAIELCALLRATSEEAIAALIPGCDATATFRWLRSRSFVEARPEGLVPHDLAREVLLADLRWRAPGELAALVRAAHAWFGERAQRASSPARWAEEFAQIAFLTRHHPRLRGLVEVPATFAAEIGVAEPAERDAILAAAGDDRDAVGHWWDVQPEAFLVARREDRALVAFAANVVLDGLADPVVAHDAVAAEALAHARAAGFRDGDVVLSRAFHAVHRDAPDPAVRAHGAAVALMLTARPLLERPRLAFAYLALQPEAVPQYEAIIGLTGGVLLPRAPGAARVLAVQDRRAISPAEWLAALGARTAAEISESEPGGSPRLLALERAAFEDAVGGALRAYFDDDRLAENPLLQSRMVVARAGRATGAERLSILRDLLRDAIEDLGHDEAGVDSARALRALYLTPSPSDVHAASVAIARMPYVTMRGLVAIGVEAVAETLWELDNEAST